MHCWKQFWKESLPPSVMMSIHGNFVLKPVDIYVTYHTSGDRCCFQCVKALPQRFCSDIVSCGVMTSGVTTSMSRSWRNMATHGYKGSWVRQDTVHYGTLHVLYITLLCAVCDSKQIRLQISIVERGVKWASRGEMKSECTDARTEKQMDGKWLLPCTLVYNYKTCFQDIVSVPC